jgi:hypothetical protein
MKLSALSAISFATFAFVANTNAGPAAVSGGPAQPDTDGAVYAPTTLQTTSGLSPGANANNTAASSSSAGGVATSTAPASSSTAATAEANPNPGHSGFDNGSSTGTAVNPHSAVELKKEKVAEISQESLAAETAKTREKKSELSKKFDSSLLDQAVDITAPQAIPKSGVEKANEANSETKKSAGERKPDGHRPTNGDASRDDR